MVTALYYFMVCLSYTRYSLYFHFFELFAVDPTSCTKRLTEWIDSFLKAAAQKLLSYVQDTNNQRIATKVLKHLILLILRMKAVMLRGRYFHQTKRTALETLVCQLFCGTLGNKFIAKL